MGERLTIRTLKPDDLPQMHVALNDAFTDYAIYFKFTYEQFIKKFVEKLRINLPVSCGVFDAQRLIAFIFTNISEYNGVRTAYNGGTGVVPAHRNKNLTGEMYRFLLPLFQKERVAQCLLEVLENNYRAIQAYEKVGFKKSQLYHCFKLTQKLNYSLKKAVQVKEVPWPNWEGYHTFADIQPSFLDADEVLKHNVGNEKIIEVYSGGVLAGYAIYQSETGRLSQMAVSKAHRGKGIGGRLLSYMLENGNRPLTVINVPDHAREIINFLSRKGFENTLDQYEMVREM